MSLRKTTSTPVDLQTISADLAQIKHLIQQSKTVFNAVEAADYLNIELSTLYKMTSAGILPFSKPNNRLLYFSKADLDQWMLSNKSRSGDEKDMAASTYLATH